MRPRVLFLHKWPEAHHAHQLLGEQIGVAAAEAMAPPGPRRLPVGVRNAWRLARDPWWESLFSESPCFEGLFLRVLDRRRRTRVRLDGANSCLRMDQFPWWERLVRRLEMRSWDGMVVFGEDAAEATRRFLGPRTEVAIWTPRTGWGDPFGEVVSNPGGRMVSIARGVLDASPARTRDRIRHKGLDRLAAVAAAGVAEGWGPVTVYGEWPDHVGREFGPALEFGGAQPAQVMLPGASVMVHLARRDGFALSVLDGMVAGVPTVVSGVDSARLVAQVEPRLVVTESPGERDAIEAVRWVRGLPPAEHRRLGARLREAALAYAESPEHDDAIGHIRRLLGYRDTPAGSPA